MREFPFYNTRITGGFWKEKQDLVRNTTIYAVYDRFKDVGRFRAYDFNWEEGMPDQPHFFWDSDTAKMIESIACLTKLKKNAKLEKLADDIIKKICSHQDENGYFNVYYMTVDKDPSHRFATRDRHELYCLGHLIEAAIAYDDATGKDALLQFCFRFLDYVEQRFMIEKNAGFQTPGHEEIELALVRLYDYTGNKKYLKMASHFVDERGKREEGLTDWSHESYNQSHLPVRMQKTAEGHAVRAMYLYSAMADLALRTGDEELLEACKALYDNILTRRSYITGSIGQSSCGEAFTVDYDLPNMASYSETCAAIGLMMFSKRMMLFGADRKYADMIERLMYNGFISGLSLSGKAFFYENPLEIMPYFYKRNVSNTFKEHAPATVRKEYFGCSCCPPNITRVIPSIASYLYTEEDGVLYVHQFMKSVSTLEIGGKSVKITQKTAYPENGKVQITVKGSDLKLAVRVPGWCREYTGETAENGYAYMDVKDGETVTVNFPMKVHFIAANPRVLHDAGKVAVMRGPFVYCMEAVDNGEGIRNLKLNMRSRMKVVKNQELGVNVLVAKGFRPAYTGDALYREYTGEMTEQDIVLVPYYTFANRGESEMQVFTDHT